MDFDGIQHVINFDMPKEIDDYGTFRAPAAARPSPLRACTDMLAAALLVGRGRRATVHRIGRTGRRGKTGVATTFINKNCSEQILLDLKHLLIEAKQRVPPVLAALEEYEDNVLLGDDNDKGCSFCGGLGHRIAQCPKLEAQRAKEASAMRDRNQGTRGGGEM